jgi:aldose 1-epimerase
MTNRYSVTADVRDGVGIVLLNEGNIAAVEIAPSLGNNCFSFRTSVDVLEPIPFSDFVKRPTSYGIPILFPFPNRIRDGSFTFQGQTYAVDPPRHGFVRDKSWTVVAHGVSDEEGAWITSAFDAGSYPGILRQYPSSFRLEVTYRLRDGRLEMETMAHNTGKREMPVGFGIHPYFRKPAAGSVTVPADQRWELSDSLPTGRILPVDADYDLRQGRSLEGLSLDDIFTGIEAGEDGIASCVLQDQEVGTETVVEFPAAQFPHVVVYTPPTPRQAICVEPNTCPTDAFNLQQQGVGSNVIVLGAGGSVTFSLSIYTRRAGSPAAT